MFLQSTLFIILWLAKAASMAVAAPALNYGCLTRCGNVNISYPFGIGANCAANDWFNITCDNTSYLPKPFISSINLEVLDIDPETSTVRVNSPVFSSSCPNRRNPGPDHLNLNSSPFSFSESRNLFIATGCSMIALLTQESQAIGGCVSICNEGEESLSISECSGISCCQVSLPRPLKYVNVSLESINGDRDGANGSCKYAFMTDQQYQDLLTTKFMLVAEDYYLPATLEWEMYNYTSCRDACDYYNAFCKIIKSQTFQCSCFPGYKGNPYLQYGCQSYELCTNSNSNAAGSYYCNIKKSFRVKAIFIGLGTSFGTLILLIGAWRLYKVIKRRKKIMLKAKFFKQNGGLLLQRQLSSNEGNVERIKLITSKELEKATDQYNKNRILGQGGQGTVYKGMLADGRIIAVKKSKIEDKSKLGQFINEVVILSQINHRNVVKLLGCCLETEVPLLVYEFIPNGTLSQHIQNEEFPFAWEMRLQIATEIAGALSYLHSAASIPIYHRDIKSTNILLDEKYQAKVADFGTSRLVALDKTHLTTLVQGTFGYLDPEYFHTSKFTDKSDVYSFGVVLVELLTGQKPITLTRSDSSEEVRNLAIHFIISMERNSLNDILDAKMGMEGREEEIRVVAKLARRCLNLKGRNRPTMKSVAIELERLKISQGGGNIIHQSFEKVDYDPPELTAPWDSASTSSGPYTDISLASSSDDRSLLLNKSLNDILDARMVVEGRKEEIRAVANLARRCLNLNGRNRPTMY